MQVMHTIHLHGHLARFGESYTLAVSSPLEAARFLIFQIEGFGEALREGAYKLVRGDRETGLEYGEEELEFSLGPDGEDFHIVPVVAGSKSGGIGKIVLGALIMTAAIVAAPFTGGYSGWAGTAYLFEFGVGGSFAFGLGAAFALGGIGTMLQPAIKSDIGMRESPDQRPSFFLNGPVNMGEQGAAIPVLYGRFMCGSVVINASLEAVDV